MLILRSDWLSTVFARARGIIAGIERPTFREMLSVYRQCRSGGTVFIRCRFEEIANAHRS